MKRKSEQRPTKRSERSLRRERKQMAANQEVAPLDNKIRVHELAKQLKSTSKRILEMLKEMGIENVIGIHQEALDAWNS